MLDAGLPARSRARSDRPTLIIVDSHIAYGAPNKQDTSAAHGEPLGEEEIRLTKRSLRLARGRQVPRPRRRLRALPARASASAARSCATPGSTEVEEYKAKYPELADQLYRMQHRQLPEGWDKDLPTFPADAKGMATRDSSGKVLNALAKNVPWLIGGSADLAPSTKTRLTFEGAGDFEAGNYGGRNLHFGIREHAMGGDPQRHGAGQGPALRLGLPDLQRLRPAADPPGRDHGDPGHLRLHARLDRRRRGRPDAPADRAARLAPGDPRPDQQLVNPSSLVPLVLLSTITPLICRVGP